MSALVGAARLFTSDELKNFVLRDDVLPNRTDVLLYMLSGSKKDVNKTADKVLKIWEAADCCHVSLTATKKAVEKLISEYKSFLRNHNNDGTKKSKQKKKKQKKKPGLVTVSEQEPFTKKARLDSLKENALRVKWNQEHGEQLFDVLSPARRQSSTSYFDEEFYLDQKDPARRQLPVMLTKVTTEFFKLEMKRRRTAAMKFPYQNSTSGNLR